MDPLLAASVATLLVGPLFYRFLKGREETLQLLDGFLVVSIAGLVVLHILPEALPAGGWWILAVTALGMIGPTMIERSFERLGQRTHLITLGLGMFGLALHAITDGAALNGECFGHEHGHEHSHIHVHSDDAHAGDANLLSLAVILHRLPVGMAIWWFLRPTFGFTLACSVLLLVVASTALGYYVGPEIVETLPPAGLALFQSLVAGSLLHVVFHRPHMDGESCGHDHGGSGSNGNIYEGIGGFAGLGLLWYLMPGLANTEIFHTFYDLALESAPALLLGYAMAGLLSVFMPGTSIRWMNKGSPAAQSLRGMAVGLPIPVCSCGVVPLYRSLITRGAPVSGAMAFLVATPELGLDAVLLSVPLLGGPFTALRVAAAAIVAFLVGWLVGRRTKNTSQVSEADTSEASRASLATRSTQAMRIGFGEVLDNTAPWILLGLAIAAIASPLLEDSFLTKTAGPLQVVIFALIGLPTYVCATGATPIVAVLLAGGVSPGAGLAFLLTGPATNATTFGLLSKLHGKSVALGFSLVIIGLSIALGIGIDLAWTSFEPLLATEGAHDHGDTSWFSLACLYALTAAVAASLLRRGPRAFAGEIEILVGDSGEDHGGSHHHSHSHDHAETSTKDGSEDGPPKTGCCS